MPSVVSRTAAYALVRWCTAERRLRRTTDRVSRALAGLVWASSTPEERTRVGLALHDALEHRTTRADGGLFEWEARWFRESLPAPPARILVGGAGSGRETLALLDRGYEVHAFEPAPLAFAALRQNVGDRARVWRATYQELARVMPGGRYDAVVLGWTSFACLVEDEDREQLLRVLASTCPTGPILASFPVRRGRDRGLGRAARAAARAVAPSAAIPAGVTFVPSGGFVRPVDEPAARALGQIIGRRAVWQDAIGMGYVTWVR